MPEQGRAAAAGARSRSSRPASTTCVREGLQSGRLTLRARRGRTPCADAEFVYLCVPTPQGEDGSADLSYIEAAAAEIAPLLRPRPIVVNKSTVPVGSTRVVEQALGRSDVFVVSNPEFLREGSAVHDFLHPDRVVIGSDDQAAAIRVAALYIGVAAPLMVTDPASAETIKYASNAFLATKLSFVNAVAAVCEAVGADVNDVVLGMGYDKRIGHEFLRPGPGWGGSLLPEGLAGAASASPRTPATTSTCSRASSSVNERAVRPGRREGRARWPAAPSRARSSACGASRFKARTDDLRESPALADRRAGCWPRARSCRAYDPAVNGPLAELPEASRSSPTPTPPCDGAEVLAVLTEWDEFKWLDLDKVAELMADRRASSTPATCSTARPSPAAASPTRASAGA